MKIYPNWLPRFDFHFPYLWLLDIGSFLNIWPCYITIVWDRRYFWALCIAWYFFLVIRWIEGICISRLTRDMVLSVAFPSRVCNLAKKIDYIPISSRLVSTWPMLDPLSQSKGWIKTLSKIFNLSQIKQAANHPSSKTCARGLSVGRIRPTRRGSPASGSYSIV